jgi:hypothetical protein
VSGGAEQAGKAVKLNKFIDDWSTLQYSSLHQENEAGLLQQNAGSLFWQ